MIILSPRGSSYLSSESIHSVVSDGHILRSYLYGGVSFGFVMSHPSVIEKVSS